MNKSLPARFSETLIIWWRFGKEHGGDEFQVNQPQVITAHLGEKAERFRQEAGTPWRWWQVNDDLIIERPPPEGSLFGTDSRIYYLLDKGLAVIENVHMPAPDERWSWLVRITDFTFQEDLDCWLMKDLFIDIVVEEDNRTYHLFDLPDMAQALDLGLITPRQSGEILKRVDWLVNRLSKGEFPFEEIRYAQEAARQMGW